MKDGKITAVVVGCGSIGALKSNTIDTPGGDNVLTHAHAYKRNKNIELLGFVDQDVVKAEEAAVKWDAGHWNGIPALMESTPPDVVSVCVDTKEHAGVLFELLAHAERPQLVIAEKPFCNNADEARAVARAYKAAGVSLLINYTRRFDLSMAMLARELENAKVYHARVVYGHGLKRDGCHGVDLFRFLFGECTAVFRDWQTKIHDASPDDPTLNLYMRFDRCPSAQLVAIDSRAYDAFELDIFHETGHIHFPNHGLLMRTRGVEQEKTYGNTYNTLSPHHAPFVTNGTLNKAGFGRTGLINAIPNLINHAVSHLQHGMALRCTPHDAVKVHEILEGGSYA